jgi:soluble lytic murein transglycosylase
MSFVSFGGEVLPGRECPSASECLDDAISTLNRRDTETAVRRLQDLIRKHPDTLWAGRASLILGRQYHEQGDRQAVPYLLNASQQLPIVGDYALYYLGEALYLGKDWNGAGTAFDLLVSRYPKSLLSPQALARSVEAWFQAEDCRRTKERQRSFLAAYPRHALQPAVLLRQGDCEQKTGDLQAAVMTYRQIWSQYAASPPAQEAAIRLQALKMKGVSFREATPQDWWIRAKTLVDAGQYEAAVAALQETLKFGQGAPDRPQTMLQLGIARVRLKQYDAARVVLAELARSRSGTPAQEAAVWLGRIYLRQGQDEPLLELAEQAAGYLSGELKAKFLLLLAAQHVDRGRIEAAISVYRQAGKEDGTPLTASEAYWQVGWLQYQEGRYRDAVRAFEDSRGYIPTGSSGARARYWEARSLEKLGDATKARQTLEILCGEAPNSYYCQSGRARNGSLGVGRESPPTAGVVSVEISEPKDQSIKADSHYQRAVELRLLGWRREAAEEFGALSNMLGNDRGGILWLARLLHGAGEYHRALTLIQVSFPEVLERGGAAIPKEFWELAYPAGYHDLIRGVSPAADWDPHVVTAVIREESAYNPMAVSSAGALGLMQVMPQTAQMILAELGSDAFSRDRLFDPCYNIRLGSRYLAQLRQKFQNNLIYAIAAYNAGPDAVLKWVRQFGDKEPDEFIDSIPYTETRNYVKKVMRSYWEYKRIYGSTSPPRFLDKLC